MIKNLEDHQQEAMRHSQRMQSVIHLLNEHEAATIQGALLEDDSKEAAACKEERKALEYEFIDEESKQQRDPLNHIKKMSKQYVGHF